MRIIIGIVVNEPDPETKTDDENFGAENRYNHINIEENR